MIELGYVVPFNSINCYSSSNKRGNPVINRNGCMCFESVRGWYSDYDVVKCRDIRGSEFEINIADLVRLHEGVKNEFIHRQRVLTELSQVQLEHLWNQHVNQLLKQEVCELCESPAADSRQVSYDV